MLHKAKGVVLGYIKYGDTSIITKIYTDTFGLQTYIVNGVRSKSSKNKIALFQPLTLLDMVVYHKENKDINRISEVKCYSPFHSIPFNQKKISMAMFMAEVLSKTVKEQHPNQELFDLVFHSVSYLDEMEEQYENMHLLFMIQLAAYIGFSPSSAEDVVSEIRISLTKEETNCLNQFILTTNLNQTIRIDNATRRRLLDCLVRYYALHVENFGTLNTLPILQEIAG